MNMINKFLALMFVGLLNGSFVLAMDQAPNVSAAVNLPVEKSAILYKQNKFENNSPTSVSADGKKMVYLSNEGKSFSLLLDNGTGDFVEKIFDGNGSTYTCITMSPDGKMVVTATEKCLLFMTITNIDKMDFSTIEFPNNIKKLIFSADSKKLVSLDESSVVKIFDIKNIHEITGKSLMAAGQNVSDVVMNPDGSKVIAIADNKVIVCSIKVSSSQEIDMKRNFFSSEHSLKGIAIGHHGECFIVWDSANRMQICTFDSESENINTYFMKNKYQKNISSVVFSPDGKYIASLGENGFVLWNKESANRLVSGLLNDDSQTMSSGVIAFSHDSKKILLCDNDQLFCFDVSTLVTNGVCDLDPDFIIDIEDKNIQLSKLYFDNDNGKIIISGSKAVVIDIQKDEKKIESSFASVIKKNTNSTDELRDIDRILLLNSKANRSVDWALSQGANPNVFDEKFTDLFGKPCLLTPLQLACYSGHKSNVASLLKAGAYVNECSKVERYSPLYLAIGNVVDSDAKKKERCEIVQMLLEHKADIGFIDDSSRKSILFCAVETQNLPLVDLLLDIEGINLHAVSSYGFNVLTMAISPNGEVDLLCKLFDLGVRPIVDKNGSSLMHHAVLAENVKIIRELVARGFNINVVNDKKYTPLHLAAGFANAETVKELILLGADPRKVNSAGKTPLGLHLSLPLSNQKKDVLALLRSAKKPVAQKKTKEQVKIANPDQKNDSKKGSASKSSQNGKPADAQQVQSTDNQSSTKKQEPKENSPTKETAANHSQNDKPTDRQQTTPRENQATKKNTPIKRTALAEQNPAVEKNNNLAKDELKKEKSSLMQKFLATTNAVVSVLKPEQRQETFLRMGTTYAAAVHPSAMRIADSIKTKTICIQDTYLKICIPDAFQKRDKNPFVQVPYSRHVTETAARETDYFHNFSPQIEKKLGTYVNAEIFENSGRKFCSGTKYTLLANIILPKSEKEISGQLEWVVVKNNKGVEKMTHRFFKPEKQNAK